MVGWSLAEAESKTHARRLIQETCRRQGVEKDQLVIHADRGSPMIAGSVAELMKKLEVAKSHSRPRVLNDNPYIESHFKTLKYRPNYPERFDSITAARSWCRTFFHWYNRCITTQESDTSDPPISTLVATRSSCSLGRQPWMQRHRSILSASPSDRPPTAYRQRLGSINAPLKARRNPAIAY